MADQYVFVHCRYLQVFKHETGPGSGYNRAGTDIFV